MSKPNTVCRVCRKEYYCCTDSREADSWRAMACSPECYQKYMRRIEMARNKPMESIKNDILESISEEAAVKPKTRKKKAENIEDTDEN